MEVYGMASEEKMKALDAALAQIEKQYGKGSVMKLGDQSANMGIDVVPTGSLSLDLALGLPGKYAPKESAYILDRAVERFVRKEHEM